MTKKERNTHSIKIALVAEILADTLRDAKANSDTAKKLFELLEMIVEETYNHEIMLSTSYMQTMGKRFETVIRKTSQEYNIKL